MGAGSRGKGTNCGVRNVIARGIKRWVVVGKGNERIVVSSARDAAKQGFSKGGI